jgi:hypothetical protein
MAWSELIWLRAGSKGGALSLMKFGLHDMRGFPDKLRNVKPIKSDTAPLSYLHNILLNNKDNKFV